MEGKKIAIIAGSIAGVILLSVGGFYVYTYINSEPASGSSENRQEVAAKLGSETTENA